MVKAFKTVATVSEKGTVGNWRPYDIHMRVNRTIVKLLKACSWKSGILLSSNSTLVAPITWETGQTKATKIPLEASNQGLFVTSLSGSSGSALAELRSLRDSRGPSIQKGILHIVWSLPNNQSFFQETESVLPFIWKASRGLIVSFCVNGLTYDVSLFPCVKPECISPQRSLPH